MPSSAGKVVDCVVAVEDARVFNPGTVYMRHALPAYVRPFLACLRGLAGGAALRFAAVTFNREPAGADFRHLTDAEQPADSEEALLRCLAGVTFARYPDPGRTERVPVGHLSRLLSRGGSGVSSDAAECHLLLIIHSRLEDDMSQLKLALAPLTSLTVLSPRRNDQLTELFGHVNGSDDLGHPGTQPHPKWELVLVPRCIRFSPPSPPPAPPQPLANQLKAAPDTPRQSADPTQATPAAPQGRVVWSGQLQFSQPDLCPATTVQFVQLGQWSTEWNFRSFDQPRPCASCALLKPEIAQAIEQICQGAGHDRLLVRPAGQSEVSPLHRLFETAASGAPKVALIFCDLKGPKPGPGLARCLVARFDAQQDCIVASVPPDQEKFLKDIQARFQKQQQQQRPPPPPLPQPQQQQPQVTMYMAASHPQQQQQQQQQHYQLQQLRPHHQQTTIVVSPASVAASAGGPPAKISRVECFHPGAGMRVVTHLPPAMSHPAQPHAATLVQAPVPMQRIAVPVTSAYQQPQQHLVITQQPAYHQPQHQLMHQQPYR